MSMFLRSSRLLARQGAQLVQARNYAEAAALKLTLAGANKVFYDAVEVRQVDVPSFSGDFGILATHVPTLGKSLWFLQLFEYARNSCNEWIQNIFRFNYH